MDIDDAQLQLGKHGKWQFIVFNVWTISFMSLNCFQLLQPIFVVYRPEFVCAQSQKPGQHDRCFNNNNTSCTEFVFETNNSRTTIVSDFQLVCERDNLGELSITAFVLGGILASNIVASLSDKFGRKPLLIVSLSLATIFSTISSFSNSYTMYVVVRAATGFFAFGVPLTGIVGSCEVFSSRFRTIPCIAMQVWWFIFMFLMCLLAYLLRSWRDFQLAISLIPAVMVIPVCFLPEALPWLAKNNPAKAETVLRKAAAMNGKISLFPEVPFLKRRGAEGKSISENYHSFCLLFRHRVIIKYMAIMTCVEFVNVIFYWGVSYVSIMRADNIYLNFFLQSLVEIPAIGICLFALPRFGRRLSLSTFHAVAGIMVLGTIAIPAHSQNILVISAQTFFQLFAKLAITSSFNESILYATEIFPTNARNTANGFTAFFSRIAAMIAPFMLSLARIIEWLPAAILGVLAICVAFLGLFLPETQNRPLPQTAEELEEWDRSQELFDFTLPVPREFEVVYAEE